MSRSIDSLDSGSQEILDLESKEIQYHLRMEIVDIIAAWIKSSRLNSGLTQPQLGDLMGVTKGNVSAWEKKRHEPSVAQIVRIGQICKTPLPKELGIENRLDQETLRFALSYQALPIEFRKQILDTLTTAEIAAKSLARQQKNESGR